jgi:alkylation response protein AidB-like acyl-CoA dehydrogenase
LLCLLHFLPSFLTLASRANLLNRVADVTPEGIYTAEHIPEGKRFALLLNPLSGGRVSIVSLAATNLKSALTIAIRYSAVRQQFGPADEEEELPVIEYQLQQSRLLPYLASVFAIEAFSRWLSSQHQKLLSSVKVSPRLFFLFVLFFFLDFLCFSSVSTSSLI